MCPSVLDRLVVMNYVHLHMRRLPKIRALWAAGFLMLVVAQFLHAYSHWEQIAGGDHSSCSHSHSPASDPSSPSDPAADHCHSPAIIVAQVTMHHSITVAANSVVEPGMPDAPVRSIDYPPQLS